MKRLAATYLQTGTAALVLAAGLACFTAPGQVRAEESAAAQNQGAPPPLQDDGRYTFHRSGEGFLRLDSRTGQLALCGWGPTGWSCKMVPDERAALESEIGRLQRDNAAMKQSLLSRGLELPSGVMAEAPAPGPVPPAAIPDPSAKEPKMPSDAEIDRALTFMKQIWRKLVDLMVDLQRDMQRKS